MPQAAPSNPQMEELGDGRVWITPSKTRPGFNHVTLLMTNGKGVVCTCDGFRYRRKCWHSVYVINLTGAVDDGEFQVNL